MIWAVSDHAEQFGVTSSDGFDDPACIATGDLIAQAGKRNVLDPKIAFRLAVEIMFSTAKMVPLTTPV